MDFQDDAPRYYEPTTTLKKILRMRRKYRFVGGGTDAAKTSSIMQVLLDMGGVMHNKRIDVVGKSIPHVRDGAWDEANKIMTAQNYANSAKIVKSPDLHIVMPTGTNIHFLSFDNLAKAHGPRRDVLFINEANYIPWPIADQLMTRTNGPVYADWNPSAPFWAYDQIMRNEDFAGAYDFARVTYKDNESLSLEKIADLERRRGNAAWWRVYGEGLLGKVEGQVYPDWQWINKIPFGAKLIYRGLDFGFTNDPTALIAIYAYDNGYILDEELYQRGWLDEKLANFIATLPQPDIPIIADSSEPKAIAGLRHYGQPFGLNVIGVKKYAGSKLDMVNSVKEMPIRATARSTHLREEQEQYLWYEDPLTGQFTNILIDGFDHALDASAYGLSTFMTGKRRLQKRQQHDSGWDFSKTYGRNPNENSD
jgi:phage terminase large subunit